MVSIVIPLYNSQMYISDTIESCLKQSVYDIEVIVVDDCSTDNSREVAEAIMKTDNRVQLYCNDENMGVIKTINRGIFHSSGDYIIVLGNDDILDEKHVEKAMKKIQEKRYSFLYFSSYIIDETGSVRSKRVFEDVSGNNLLFARKNPINACGAMINSEYLKKLGGYPENLGFRNCGEWYLWIELLEIEECAYVENVMSYYRIHSQNLTKKLYSKKNIKSTRDYSILCMKKALELKGISPKQKLLCCIFRFLYAFKMNIKMIFAK